VNYEQQEKKQIVYDERTNVVITSLLTQILISPIALSHFFPYFKSYPLHFLELNTFSL